MLYRFQIVHSVAAFTIAWGCAAGAHTGEYPWPTKTGPFANGTARAEDSVDLPVTWDVEAGENIAWKIPLEGFGHSTPVIGNGRAWFTSATEDGKRQFIYCINTSDGAVIHHKLLFENAAPEPLNNPINTYASPTCVLTDNAVYVHFGTYGTTRLNPDTAAIVWERRDIHARHFRGPGSSPILEDGLLVLSFDGIDKQFLIALDAETGDTEWRTPRTTDYGDIQPDGLPLREGDLRKAYSTPSVVEVNGRKQVVSVGSRAAFAYDLKTGKELWTIRHDDYNAAAQPLFFNDLAILNTGSAGANLLAVQLGESTRGDVTDSHVLYNRPTGNSRLAFPVLHEKRIYFVTGNGVAASIDAASGEEIWRKRIGGDYIASPVLAGGMLYCVNDNGKVTVLKAADDYQVVATNYLPDGMRASPAVADSALYLRTFTHLYKIAK